MNCPVCGKELTDAGATCPRCGQVESVWARPVDTNPTEPPARAWQVSAAPVGYGDPDQYLAAHPETRVDSYPVIVAPRKKTSRLLAVLIGALCLVLIGSGVAVAGGYLGWYGGGKRPSDVLPGSALSYGQLDLDPSLLQKTAAWQFLRDLPEVKAAVAAGLPDPKALLWKLMVTDDEYLGALNYDTDVKPWLGNRYGVAFVNHLGKPVWVAAVQLADTEVGVRTLKGWLKKAGSDNDVTYDVTVRDNYALLTEAKDTFFILDEIAKGTLTDNPTFAADFAALGEPGVSAGWTDLSSWQRMTGQNLGSVIGMGHGRLALATRFTADTLEVAGITRGFTGGAAIPDGDLGLLPADTGVALSITGAGKALAEAWSQLPQQAKDSVADLKLSLPDDLVALLGNSLVVAASADTVQHFMSSAAPEIGLRVNSDAASRAEQVLHTLADGVSPDGISTTVNGAVLFAGTTAGYRDRIAGGGDRLSSNEWFARTVPDHAKATFAAWVDPQAVVGNRDVGSATGDYDLFLSALRGWGSQYVPGAPGEGAWSVRLVRA
jgi:hypothetical protein